MDATNFKDYIECVMSMSKDEETEIDAQMLKAVLADVAEKFILIT